MVPCLSRNKWSRRVQAQNAGMQQFQKPLVAHHRHQYQFAVCTGYYSIRYRYQLLKLPANINITIDLSRICTCLSSFHSPSQPQSPFSHRAFAGEFITYCWRIAQLHNCTIAQLPSQTRIPPYPFPTETVGRP